jgi:hypothetical protein
MATQSQRLANDPFLPFQSVFDQLTLSYSSKSLQTDISFGDTM